MASSVRSRDEDDGRDTAGKPPSKCRKYTRPVIVVDNFVYDRVSVLDSHARWTCDRALSLNCPSVLLTTIGLTDLKLLSAENDHVHPSNKCDPAGKDQYPAERYTLILLQEIEVFNQKNGKRRFPYNGKIKQIPYDRYKIKSKTLQVGSRTVYCKSVMDLTPTRALRLKQQNECNENLQTIGNNQNTTENIIVLLDDDDAIDNNENESVYTNDLCDRTNNFVDLTEVNVDSDDVEDDLQAETSHSIEYEKPIDFLSFIGMNSLSQTETTTKSPISGPPTSTMIKKVNPDGNTIQPSAQKSVTTLNSDFTIQKQKTPHTIDSTTEKDNTYLETFFDQEEDVDDSMNLKSMVTLNKIDDFMKDYEPVTIEAVRNVNFTGNALQSSTPTSPVSQYTDFAIQEQSTIGLTADKETLQYIKFMNSTSENALNKIEAAMRNAIHGPYTSKFIKKVNPAENTMQSRFQKSLTPQNAKFFKQEQIIPHTNYFTTEKDKQQFEATISVRSKDFLDSIKDKTRKLLDKTITSMTSTNSGPSTSNVIKKVNPAGIAIQSSTQVSLIPQTAQFFKQEQIIPHANDLRTEKNQIIKPQQNVVADTIVILNNCVDNQTESANKDELNVHTKNSTNTYKVNADSASKVMKHLLDGVQNQTIQHKQKTASLVDASYGEIESSNEDDSEGDNEDVCTNYSMNLSKKNVDIEKVIKNPSVGVEVSECSTFTKTLNQTKATMRNSNVDPSAPKFIKKINPAENTMQSHTQISVTLQNTDFAIQQQNTPHTNDLTTEKDNEHSETFHSFLYEQFADTSMDTLTKIEDYMSDSSSGTSTQTSVTPQTIDLAIQEQMTPHTNDSTTEKDNEHSETFHSFLYELFADSSMDTSTKTEDSMSDSSSGTSTQTSVTPQIIDLTIQEQITPHTNNSTTEKDNEHSKTLQSNQYEQFANTMSFTPMNTLRQTEASMSDPNSGPSTQTSVTPQIIDLTVQEQITPHTNNSTTEKKQIIESKQNVVADTIVLDDCVDSENESDEEDKFNVDTKKSTNIYKVNADSALKVMKNLLDDVQDNEQLAATLCHHTTAFVDFMKYTAMNKLSQTKTSVGSPNSDLSTSNNSKKLGKRVRFSIPPPVKRSSSTLQKAKNKSHAEKVMQKQKTLHRNDSTAAKNWTSTKRQPNAVDNTIIVLDENDGSDNDSDNKDKLNVPTKNSMNLSKENYDSLMKVMKNPSIELNQVQSRLQINSSCSPLKENEVTIAKIVSKTGVVTITSLDDRNGHNDNPLVPSGIRRHVMSSTTAEDDSRPPNLPSEDNFGTNSSASVIPISNGDELPDNLHGIMSSETENYSKSPNILSEDNLGLNSSAVSVTRVSNGDELPDNSHGTISSETEDYSKSPNLSSEDNLGLNSSAVSVTLVSNGDELPDNSHGTMSSETENYSKSSNLSSGDNLGLNSSAVSVIPVSNGDELPDNSHGTMSSETENNSKSPNVSSEDNLGLNSSAVSVIPVSNGDELPDNLPNESSDLTPAEIRGAILTRRILEVLFRNRREQELRIDSTYSLAEAVPEAIPLLSTVRDKLRMELSNNDSTEYEYSHPTPRILIHVHRYIEESVTRNELELDLEFHFQARKRFLRNSIRCMDVFFLHVRENQNIEDCAWQYVCRMRPVFLPDSMIIQLSNANERSRIYFSSRVQGFDGKFSDCSLPQCILSTYNIN